MTDFTRRVRPRSYYWSAAVLVLVGVVLGLGLSAGFDIQMPSIAQKAGLQATQSNGAAPESPFVTVVECPQARMIEAIGPTLVGTAITCNDAFRRQLADAVQIDRLNLGPVPTTRLNWLQPHEGNIIEFLFRARAFQSAPL